MLSYYRCWYVLLLQLLTLSLHSQICAEAMQCKSGQLHQHMQCTQTSFTLIAKSVISARTMHSKHCASVQKLYMCNQALHVISTSTSNQAIVCFIAHAPLIVHQVLSVCQLVHCLGVTLHLLHHCHYRGDRYWRQLHLQPSHWPQQQQP
jgi:hypothetical protein